MPTPHRLQEIKTFPSLVKYLRDELDWPIETQSFDDLTFDFEPAELGIDAKTAAKIRHIKQLRPLATNQPWGIFFVDFEPKRLPIAALRKILGGLVLKRRASANKAERASWSLHDLLFISAFGDADHREITLAHFSEPAAKDDLPTLKVLGWDEFDAQLKLQHVDQQLHEKLRWPQDPRAIDDWRQRWSSTFVLRPRQVISTAKELAARLAVLARLIRRRADLVLEIETDAGPLRKLYAAFNAALIHDLSEADFTDMYAQTITYGLFSAAVSRITPDVGTIVLAENLVEMVPVTNPFLKEMLATFLTVGGRKGKLDFDELGIQEVVELLNSKDTNLPAVLRDFGNRVRGEDPVIHFYEDFLREYDKKRKVQRGVFYTPQPVVSYIVRSVHELLQTEFGLPNGLADTTTWGEMAVKVEAASRRLPAEQRPSATATAFKIPEGIAPDSPFVQILDPATGTATFLVEVIDVIHATMVRKWKAQRLNERQIVAAWNEYVPKHLLPRLHGYELMMAPYAIAHMKIGLKLHETGYRFASDERARVFLTNALEPPQTFSDRLEFDFSALFHEAQAVNAVKRRQRFTVVIGNPPYSNLSANLTPESRAIVEAYKFVGDQRIKERGALSLEKNLNDDYVKFVRLSQLAVGQLGVCGLVTNNGFMGNPTLRGMRYSLLTTFETYHVLNLMGYAGSSTRISSESLDENVFDIANAGVAIQLGCHSIEKGSTRCVKYAEIQGCRSRKYTFLSEHTLRSTPSVVVFPEAPFFSLEPADADLKGEYELGISLLSLFNVNSTGIRTLRDSFVVDFHDNSILERVQLFKDSKATDEELCSHLGLDMPGWWKVSLSRRRLSGEKDLSKYMRQFAYRPFDIRRLFYHEALVGSPRRPVMRHMETVAENMGLHICRQLSSPSWQHVLVTRGLTDDCYVSNRTKERGYTVPLFLLQDRNKFGFVETTPNCDLHILDDILSQNLADRTPQTVFNYIYAILYSPCYRSRYIDFLKRDFPRLPFTGNLELFRALACLGGELVALHLLESPKLDQPITEIIGGRNPEVEKVSWSDETVWIDKAQSIGFKGVHEAVWNFHVGGYQVCQKWLKDRKGRTLSKDDIAHYHKIVVALAETIRLMAEIDTVIDQFGGWPGAFAGAPKLG